MFQIDNVYAKLQNYTGVQLLRVWCEGCDAPPSSGIETVYIICYRIVFHRRIRGNCKEEKELIHIP